MFVSVSFVLFLSGRYWAVRRRESYVLSNRTLYKMFTRVVTSINVLIGKVDSSLTFEPILRTLSGFLLFLRPFPRIKKQKYYTGEKERDFLFIDFSDFKITMFPLLLFCDFRKKITLFYVRHHKSMLTTHFVYDYNLLL